MYGMTTFFLRPALQHPRQSSAITLALLIALSTKAAQALSRARNENLPDAAPTRRAIRQM
jgi:hypothetical protein